MGICWLCHWGWPKQVRDIYDKYEKLINDSGGDAFTALNYGPAHKEEHIQWCIDNAQEYRNNLSNREVELVIESLKELKQLPDDILDPVPEDYDDEHPENFPPREGLVMVRKY